MATSPAGRPAWQRNRVFAFFASLRLAVVLLAVLILAGLAGTFLESRFDAKVARAYVYGAPWFLGWLLLLVANLTASALSRWPWRQHHVAFLVTHLGIITLLFGALIGRLWGIEGTITLHQGHPPDRRLLLDERELRVRASDGTVRVFPVEFAQRPRELGRLASGARLHLVEYAPALESRLDPKPLADGGAPALHWTLRTAMMGQQLDGWLLAGENPEQARFDLGGLARLELRRGAAPALVPADLEEAIFAFAKAPNDQITRPTQGGRIGAQVVLAEPHAGDSGEVTVVIAGKMWSHDVASNLGKNLPLEGSPFTLRIEGYWPDFRIENGQPASASDQPNNPAVVVTLRGHALPAVEDDSANRATLFLAENGTLSYELSSRQNGRSTGTLAPGAPLATGWADWQFTVDQILPHAEAATAYRPVTGFAKQGRHSPDGVRLRVADGSGRAPVERWIPAGREITLPATPAPLEVAFGPRQRALPIALELLAFEVERNEGSHSPAAFRSTVRVTDPEGRSAVGECSMNHPFSFPNEWWRTWTGLTFKLSQASWDPDDPEQSTIQVLRDPGWLPKWLGALLVCLGIFLLFYVKRFRRPTDETAGTSR